MKKIFRILLAEILALLAYGVLSRYKPRIVMVTGSVGKTSTKDAVACALSSRFFIRASEKSYNSEFGVPLTIFGAKNPWSSLFGWLGVFKKALGLLLLPNHYPNCLVLEVGADRPGDLAKILRIVSPDAIVITRLPEVPVHVEAYASPEQVRDEEFSPAYALQAAAPLILSADDPFAVAMSRRIPARVFSYGTDASAKVRLSHIGYAYEGHRVLGMKAELKIAGKDGASAHSGELVVKGSVGEHQCLPAAAAVACAAAFDISLEEALAALTAYVPPPGRGRLLEGKHGSVLLDDSYNASPAAVVSALETLGDFPYTKRRIACLGDMLELGRYSVAEHERIGELAAKQCDLLLAVGIRSRAIAAKARASGMSEGQVLTFDDARAAAEALEAVVAQGDAILIKGSQSVRMERIAEALLADPSDITSLVRQEHEWKKR